MVVPSLAEDLMEKGHLFIKQNDSAGVLDPGAPGPSQKSPSSQKEKVESNVTKDGNHLTKFSQWWKSLSHSCEKDDLSIASPVPLIRLPLIFRSVDKAPEGYPRLATLLDSQYRFMIYRRFGFLQSRLLLHKQDELRELEEELDKLDEEDAILHKDYLGSRRRDNAFSRKRKLLLGKIDKRFKDYTNLLTTAKTLTNLRTPIERDFLNLKRYFDKAKPVCVEECYIYHQEDTITLAPDDDRTWLDHFIERVFHKCHGKVTMCLFYSERRTLKADPKNGVLFYSARRFGVIVTLIVLTLITFLFIIPVYIIWRLTRNTTATNSISAIIGVMLAFTIVFSLALMKFTRAKRHEILAAAAGYCAVLVTFIGNIGQVSGPASAAAQNLTSTLISA